MAAPTPPRTPTARKYLPGSPSAISPNVTTTRSSISLQKRKWQGGKISLPFQDWTQPGNGSGSAPVAPMAPAKRQNVAEEIKVEVSAREGERWVMRPQNIADYLRQQQQHQYLSMPASPLQNQGIAQHPANLSCKPPPPQPSTQSNVPQQIFMAAFQRNPALIPIEPQKNPVHSSCIDAIAHAMWDVVIAREKMMNEVTMKAAMFPPLKLRTLAKLNWLPSWWYLREMACGVMARQGWLMDDSERQVQWQESLGWCKKVEMRLFGESAAAQNSGGSQIKPDPIQESVRKVDTDT